MGLAQLFTVVEPLGGVSAVTISSINLYFSAISNNMGIDFQIREVANGMPTYSVVENSRVTVRPTDTFSNGSKILQTSSNGSVASYIEFLKPVQLSALSTYALMVLPNASDPGYVLWAGNTSGNDQSTGVAISFNGAIGPLITWDPVSNRTVSSNKALKFTIQKGFANTPRYHDDNFDYNEEYIIVNDFTNPFVIGEYCFMAQTNFNFASANIFTPASTGNFINGESFIQNPGGGGTTVIGTVYNANSSVILFTNTSGPISNTLPVTGVSSGAIAWLYVVNTSIICSSLSNTITFPFTGNGSSNLFYVNQSIYITTSDLTKNQPFIVTGVSGNNIQVSWNPVFTDVNCSGGQLRGDNLALRMNYQGYDAIKQTNFTAVFNNSTANTQINQNFHFANSVGQYIIGQSSRARCLSYGTINLEYHSVIPQFQYDQAVENEHVLYWGGYLSYSNFTSQYPSVWRYLTET
jgi:hypothetical protein